MLRGPIPAPTKRPGTAARNILGHFQSSVCSALHLTSYQLVTWNVFADLRNVFFAVYTSLTFTDRPTHTPKMSYKILVGVYGDTISTLEFNPAAKSLKVIKESDVSPNPSWIAEGKGGLYSISEEERGLVTRLELNGDAVKEMSAKETGGGPAHVLVTSKGDVVVSNVSHFWPSSAVFLHSNLFICPLRLTVVLTGWE